MQQTVVGVLGVSSPTGCPPFGAQLPPVAFAGFVMPYSDPIPRQPSGAAQFFSPPVQSAWSNVATVAPAHVTPAGGSQVQALQARVSVAPWKYAWATG
jgi:hypothetical protein